MESGYTKADNRNLPKVDILMVGNFFATNPDFCSAEFRNVKTSTSARQSYGDDAIGYVQLQRESGICTIKCKVCPEHKVRAKSYAATMIVDENQEKIISVQCHDCAASTGGCKHSVAFLMWVHRRSEEPSTTETQCYWKKSKLAQVGTNLRFITAKDLCAGSRAHHTQTVTHNLLGQFLDTAASRSVVNCELLKYYKCFVNEYEKLSLHYLIVEYSVNSCDLFLANICKYFSKTNIEMVEEKTRQQNKTTLWHEFRYGRITASKAYDVSRCQTIDGSLMAMIMGSRIPHTKAMKRGQVLEKQVIGVVEKKLGKKIRECGLYISSEHPFIAGSPDGIFDNKFCIEVKCPTTEKTYKSYIKDNKATEKYMVQMHIQMYVTELKSCYFCVADCDFENTKHVEIILVKYNDTFAKKYISSVVNFWKKNVYPVLYESTK